MQQVSAASKESFETALQLNPNSFLATLQLLHIAEDKDAAKRYLELGNKVLPSNILVRAAYLWSLTPRWGGSYPELEKFIDDCRSQGVSQDQIDLLNAMKYDDQGMTAEESGNPGQARLAYRKALTLSMSDGGRFLHTAGYLRGSKRICQEPEFQSEPYCQ